MTLCEGRGKRLVEMCRPVDHAPLFVPLGQYADRAARTPSTLAREEILLPRADHDGSTRDKRAVLTLIENCLLQAKPIGQRYIACILTSDVFASGHLTARLGHG
jgi:hypothetical protein